MGTMKTVLIIIDGLGDLPTPKTPLQEAHTPTLDQLAKEGITGMLAPVGKYIVPGSDVSHLQILGYDPKKYYPGRGPLEALGAGIDLNEGDVAFRANFATLKESVVVDRRAGRIDSKTAKELAKELSTTIDDVEIIVKHTVEHRLAIVFRGKDLGNKVGETDPHGKGEIKKVVGEDKESKKTAEIMNKFTAYAIEKLQKHHLNTGRQLPANCVLLRGVGKYRKVENFEKRFGIKGSCVAGGALYKGIGKYIGLNVIDVPEATGDKNTNVNAKINAVNNAKDEFVFMHFKACDSAGHDGDFETKKNMLEKLDRALTALKADNIIITGDHSTPVSMKAHSGHEVPILVWGLERKDDVEKFDEQNCMQGGLGHIEGKDIVPLILNISRKAKKYGS